MPVTSLAQVVFPGIFVLPSLSVSLPPAHEILRSVSALTTGDAKDI